MVERQTKWLAYSFQKKINYNNVQFHIPVGVFQNPENGNDFITLQGAFDSTCPPVWLLTLGVSPMAHENNHLYNDDGTTHNISFSLTANHPRWWVALKHKVKLIYPVTESVTTK